MENKKSCKFVAQCEGFKYGVCNGTKEYYDKYCSDELIIITDEDYEKLKKGEEITFYIKDLSVKLKKESN